MIFLEDTVLRSCQHFYFIMLSNMIGILFTSDQHQHLSLKYNLIDKIYWITDL